MASNRFIGKTAIVTGAGTGIGQAIAGQLLAEGANVVINDIDNNLLQIAADKIRNADESRCLTFAGDASCIETIRDMVKFAVSETGKLDICVANAGITHFKNFMDCTPEDYRRVTDLNLQGSFFLVQESAKQMQQQEMGGRILLMSSVAGIQACPRMALYAMTKAALSNMARSLVVELGALGIAINAIAPGATFTERTKLEEPDYESTWSNLAPDHKIAQPEDISEAATFLLSDAAAHINGQTLIVDGGWTNTSPYPNHS